MDKLKISKVNEVYIHIDCEPHIAQELTEHFKFKAPGFQFTPAYRNKYWSGDIFLFNQKNNNIYYGLLPYIEQLCKEREYEIEYLSNFSSKEFSIKEAIDFIKTLDLKIEPRDYQIDSFVHCIRDNRRTIILPTGAGKSLLQYLIYRYYNKKTLLIVPTTSLIHQMSSDFESYGYEGSIHKIYSGQEKDTDHNLTISTWQSLINTSKKWFDSFELVMIDECHLAQSKSLTSIMTKLDKCKYRFGFTGTLSDSKTHKLVIEGLFGSVRKSISTSELIEQKHLSNFNIKSIVLNYPDNIKKSVLVMDYQQEIDYIVRLNKRNLFISNLALSLKGNTLLLFQYVDKHGKILYDLIKSLDPNRSVYFISGEVDGIERNKIRSIIENEVNSIIVASFGTSSTGINIKNLHNIIFSSPSKSRIKNLQSIGRGLRKSDTKSKCTLYDIADDFSLKNKKNYTIQHFTERIKIYNEEGFNYKIYKVSLEF